MKCPFCGFAQDRVVDSREIEESAAVRRRRECDRCSRRFTTYERVDEIPYMVVKKDGRREKFDRQKMLTGLQHACEKRPIAMRQLEVIADAAEAFLTDAPDRERSTAELGTLIMDELKKLDTVAYIRFASVYREFKDAIEFRDELEQLVQSRAQASKIAPGIAPPPNVTPATNAKTASSPAQNPVVDPSKEPAPQTL